jgi:ABC-type transport system involved in multi-copper enzyme maturation permease subunit
LEEAPWYVPICGEAALRLGPGPVFAYEWLTTARRWQWYAIRAVFVGVILAGMILTWTTLQQFSNLGQFVSIQTLARYGESLYETVVSIELTLVLLAAPAATAGAVCLDKARGTLDHMLATDLSNAEIVLGKLGVRLVPVLGLIACTLPVAAISGLLGGIDPTALAGSFLTAIGCAFLGCSLALALSVWGRKTHEVLMMTYVILVLWLAAPLIVALAAFALRQSSMGPPPRRILEWLAYANPYYVAFAPYSDPGKVGMGTFLAFLGACCGVSGMLLALATLRIRTHALAQAGAGATQPRHGRFRRALLRPRWLPHLPGPSLDGNPVLWREWHRTRPSRFLRVVWGLYAILGVLWIVLSLYVLQNNSRELELIGVMNMFQVALGLLLLSVAAATSLAEERARGSLDLLLSTPMATPSILAGKWLGSFQRISGVLVWPAATAALLAADSGRWFSYLQMVALILAYGAAITSLGLALATWISRLGRAIAACVSIYVVSSIGWIWLIALFTRGPDSAALPLIIGSPLYGTVLATMAVSPHGPMFADQQLSAVVTGIIFWTVCHGGLAILLFALTVRTFDRCLGRISDQPGKAIATSLKKRTAKLAMALDDWPVDDPEDVSEPSYQ